MRSLQNRLLLGTGIVIAAGLVASGAIIYSVASSALYREFDSALLGKARALAALTEHTEDGLEFDFADSDFAEFSRPEQPNYFQLWHSSGSVLSRSQSLGSDDLAKSDVQTGEARFESASLPDGRTGRQVTLVFRPKIERDDEDEDDGEDDASGEDRELHEDNGKGQKGSAVTVVIAKDTAAVDNSLARLGWLLISVGGCVSIACLSMLAFVVHRGLGPLRRVSTDIEHMSEQTLDTRIDAVSVPTELLPIVKRLNELFARLESAFNRERSFSSDVAHELRTPLTGLRSTVEVCRGKHRSSQEYCEALDVCLEICTQAQGMVESLLVISRIEAGRTSTKTQSIRLEEILRQCWEQLESDAARKGLRDSWQLSESCDLQADRDKLLVVIRNILENAVAHSDSGGEVRVSTHRRNGSVRLCVENSGNRLAHDQAEHVFQRLWRGDAARANTGKHAGLGLSLAQRLTGLLGGDINVELEGKFFRVLLDMPLK